jgi:hypothetical protein
VLDPEGRLVTDATIENVLPYGFNRKILSATGTAEVIVAREEPRKCIIDALGFRPAVIENLTADTTVTLEMAPLLRVRGRLAQDLLPTNKRLWAVLHPAGDPVPAHVAFTYDGPRLKALFINGVADLELEEDLGGHYHLRIYVEDLALTPENMIMLLSGGPPFPNEVIEIPHTTPSKIHVEGLRTEVLVTGGPLAARRLPRSPAVRLLLDAELTRSVQGRNALLWGGLIPQGEAVPTVEHLDDLPKTAGRFVGSVLSIEGVPAGSYQLRIYRVPHSWVTKHLPDVRVGRATEGADTDPRTIEVKGLPTEVEVTLIGTE